MPALLETNLNKTGQVSWVGARKQAFRTGPTWIVLPTYNEADNIATQLTAVWQAVPDGEIMVVDDGSPDGTGQILDQLKQSKPRLHVLHRPKKLGLGTAYQDGFQYALDHGATRLIQMDADGSHDPALIPTLLDQLSNVDLVLASRYVHGGRFPIVWFRRWVSTLGNLYIRLLLGRSIHDWSTGYKGWRGESLRRVLNEPARGVGYAWLMETTWLAKRLGLRIAEVPLVFQERQGGVSKFSWRIALEDLRLVWELHHRS